MRKKILIFIFILLVGGLFLFPSPSFGAEKRCCPENYQYDALKKDCFYFKEGNINENDRKPSYCPNECNVRTQLCGWEPSPTPTSPERKSCTPGDPDTCGPDEVCDRQTKTCFKRAQVTPGETQEPCPGDKCPTALGDIPTEPKEFIGWLFKFFLGIAGGIALLLIIIAGFQIATSSGDPKKLGAGKELLTAAITGLLLIIFALVILEVIGYDILNISGFGKIPPRGLR